MKRFVLGGVFAWVLTGSVAADPCAPGGSLTYPNYAVAGQLGLSVVVDARAHPARQDIEGMTVSERVAALELAFADDFGAEPERVQDLRRLGTFVEVFRLGRGSEPSVSVFLSEPEYMVALLPTLRTYDITHGVAVLDGVEDAFWRFENNTTDGLLDQFVWGSFIGVTIGDLRDMAPGQLILARDEVEAAIADLIAQDGSVAAVMEDMRGRVSSTTRRWFMIRALDECAGFYGGYGASGQPENWEDVPEPQRNLLTLERLQSNAFYLPNLFADQGWMLEDALRATQAAGLDLHLRALRDGLALFPEDVERDSDAWWDMVWDRAAELEDIPHDILYAPLRAEQDPQWEVSYEQPIRDAMESYARQVGLWPQD